jgi:hypothetical protein
VKSATLDEIARRVGHAEVDQRAVAIDGDELWSDSARDGLTLAGQSLGPRRPHDRFATQHPR